MRPCTRWVLMQLKAYLPNCSYSVCGITNQRKGAQCETVRIHVIIHSAFPQKYWKSSSCTFLPSCCVSVFGSLPVLTRLTTFAVSLLPWQPFFGGSTSINQISGKIKCGEEVLATLTGHWVTFDNRSCCQVTSPWLQGLREGWQPLAGSLHWRGHCPVLPLAASPRACSHHSLGHTSQGTLEVIYTSVVPSICSVRNAALPEPWGSWEQ